MVPFLSNLAPSPRPVLVWVLHTDQELHNSQEEEAPSVRWGTQLPTC